VLEPAVSWVAPESHDIAEILHQDLHAQATGDRRSTLPTHARGHALNAT
jgi:hypothetical protein